MYNTVQTMGNKIPGGESGGLIKVDYTAAVFPPSNAPAIPNSKVVTT